MMVVCLRRDETFWLWTNKGQDAKSLDVEWETGVRVIVECGDSYLVKHERSGFFKWIEKRFVAEYSDD